MTDARATPSAPASAGLRRLAAGTTLVAVGGVVANGLGYALALVGARWLEPATFGAYGALLAVLTVATVPQFGLQTVTAVHVARGTADPRALVRTGLWVSVGVGGALLAASPVLTGVFHLRSPLPAVLVALATVPFNAAGALLGLAQGAERFGRLAAGMVAMSVGRVGGGLVGLAVGRDLAPALAGIVAGGLLAMAAVWAWSAVARRGAAGDGDRVALAEIGRASAALLAMLTLVNMDLLLARAVLPGVEAGAYAVGAVLTKAAFWAPQVVAVVVLPRIARGHSRAFLVGLALVGASGVAAVAGTAGLGRLAVRLAGGSAYVGPLGPSGVDLVGHAWLFAAAGAGWALVNLLLTAAIAERTRWLVTPLWAAVATEVVLVLAWRPYTLTHTVLAAVATAVATVAAGLALRRAGHRAGAGHGPGRNRGS